MNFRRALIAVVVTLGLAGCASYPTSYGVGLGYYGSDYYYARAPRYGYYDGYYDGYYGGHYGYGGYPYFGWSAFYPFSGYCPARYGYCPPFGFGAFMDPYYYGFGMFMPYGYGGWYDPYWGRYGYPPRHHDHDGSHDHDHDGDNDNDNDNNQHGDDGGTDPAPPPANWRRGLNHPLPRPDPMAPEADAGEPTDAAQPFRPTSRLPMTIPPSYRPTPIPPAYRPPGATAPPGGSRPEPIRQPQTAPEPRPRARDSSDDSDDRGTKRGSGKRPPPDDASK